MGFEKNMPEIMAVLFRPITEKNGDDVYVLLKLMMVILNIRAEQMKKMSAEQVQASLFFFSNLGRGIIEDFAIIFDGTESGDNEGTSQTEKTLPEKWGWFGVMHRLCNEEISKLRRSNKAEFIRVLNLAKL